MYNKKKNITFAALFREAVSDSRVPGLPVPFMGGGVRGKGMEKFDLFNQGPMAEWLGRGLQNLIQRFESAWDLLIRLVIN